MTKPKPRIARPRVANLAPIGECPHCDQRRADMLEAQKAKRIRDREKREGQDSHAAPQG